MKLKPIDQQVIAVVEASSGIGREAALQFAKRRAKLVVSARSESGLASTLQLEQAPHGYEIFKHKKDSCIKIVLKPGQTV